MNTYVLKASLGLASILLLLKAQLKVRPAETGPGSTNQIDRGRYLVEEVAKCGECHTPRNAAGDLELDQWLQGAPTWIAPVAPISNWAHRAPPLAGLPGYSDDQAERVLENGTGPEGEAIQPPMHIYHLDPQDAKAIIAYLRSLPVKR